MMDNSWAYYAQLSSKADSTTVDDTYWARDDALVDALDRIASGLSMPTNQQLDDLIGNRRRKHRIRRRVLETVYFEITKDLHRDRSDRRHVDGQAGALSDVSTALANLTEREQQITVDLAVGATYADLAKSMKEPIGTVKTWAHRARKKLAA